MDSLTVAWTKTFVARNADPAATNVLVNVATPDMSVKLFGATYDTPIVLAPVSSQRAFHGDGEAAVARAAQRLAGECSREG